MSAESDFNSSWPQIQDVCKALGCAYADAQSALSAAGLHHAGPSDRLPLDAVLNALVAGNVKLSRLAPARLPGPPSPRLPSVKRR